VTFSTFFLPLNTVAQRFDLTVRQPEPGMNSAALGGLAPRLRLDPRSLWPLPADVRLPARWRPGPYRRHGFRNWRSARAYARSSEPASRGAGSPMSSAGRQATRRAGEDVDSAVADALSERFVAHSASRDIALARD